MQFCAYELRPREVRLNQPALLVLEDGSVFEGEGIGAFSTSEPIAYTVGEVVFNTALTGYQEILSDPSYSNQLVNLTYPHIGNVGINREDDESRKMYANGLIISSLTEKASNWRSTQSLQDYLAEQRRIGIAEIDTRRLTRIIREKGALKGCILTAPIITDLEKAKALRLAQSCPDLKGADLAQVVTTETSYTWQGGGVWQQANQTLPFPLKVVVYDFGVKESILRQLAYLGCDVEVVPAKTKAEVVLGLSPSGVLLSNGPGDPAPCTYAIQAIQQLLQVGIPLFGICLGHQLLALALGAKTFKMKFGHHGANHPVLDIETGQVLITSQNHGFAVDETSLSETIIPTHRSLFDKTLQGLRHAYLPVMGFQGHPEAGPGPQDAHCLFERFKVLMESYEKTKQTDMVMS